MLEAIRADVLEVRRGLRPPLLLSLLVPVPLLLIAHDLHQRGSDVFSSRRWDVDVDRGWIEIVGFVYMAAAVCALAVLTWRRRDAPVYAAWAFALTVVVLDDSLEAHEGGGEWLDQRPPLLDLPGLRTQDMGELLVWAGIGAALLPLLWISQRLSSPPARRDARWLTGLVGVLMFFAVALDMFHIGVAAVTSSPVMEQFLESAEAAGELSAMAGILAYVVHVARRTPTAVRGSVSEGRTATTALRGGPSSGPFRRW